MRYWFSFYVFFNFPKEMYWKQITMYSCEQLMRESNWKYFYLTQVISSIICHILYQANSIFTDAVAPSTLFMFYASIQYYNCLQVKCLFAEQHLPVNTVKNGLYWSLSSRILFTIFFLRQLPHCYHCCRSCLVISLGDHHGDARSSQQTITSWGRLG